VAQNKSTPSETVRVGVAGWSLAKAYSQHFPAKGSHLERYAARFPCVEINSSFYKPHRPTTFAQWAECVPEDFRFSVKVPKAATHERRLVDVNDVLDKFLAEATQLGEKLGPLLIQLPPSLPFTAKVADAFFAVLREVSGLPNLLKPWNDFLLEAPAQGKVVEFLPDMKARIDIGRKDGLE
jgi:uncharacterized protein YecE (DUF72 family)